MSDIYSTQPDYVTSVNVMSSHWGNENRGGFYFNLGGQQPADVELFIVRPMDIGLEMLFTLVLTAITNNRKVVLSYLKDVQTSPGKYEGDVVGISLV